MISIGIKNILLLGPTPPPMGGIARYCQDILSSNLLNKYNIIFYDVTIPYEYRPKAYTYKTNYNIIVRDGPRNFLKQIKYVINKMVLKVLKK